MCKELKDQIDKLKQQLNALIEKKASYDEIYALSRELDILINHYLDETKQ